MSWLCPSEYELRTQREAAARNRQAEHEQWLQKQFDNYGSAEKVQRNCQLWAGDSKLLAEMEEQKRIEEANDAAFLKGFLGATAANGYHVPRD